MSKQKTEQLKLELGRRPTNRGVRKCPNCDTINGSRTTVCKNKHCLFAFRIQKSPDRDVKKAYIINIGQLSENGSRMIYSVSSNLTELKSYTRSFVDIKKDGGNPINDKAVCLVPSCVGVTCEHIELAKKAKKTAKVLIIKENILDDLNISEDIRKKVWQTQSESKVPVVQRVSKQVMVVKCNDLDEKHPVGFLHIAFFSQRIRNCVEKRYFCDCDQFLVHQQGNESLCAAKCFHYYLCISAFASDVYLAKEFFDYIHIDSGTKSGSTVAYVANNLNDYNFVNYNDIEQCVIEDNFDDHLLTNLTNFTNIEIVNVRDNSINDKISENSLLEVEAVEKKTKKKYQKTGSKKKISKSSELNAATASSSLIHNNLLFVQWLSSVTEMINSSLQMVLKNNCQFLTFIIPNDFFELFKERMVFKTSKKRIPNHTNMVVRKNRPPFGTFTKHIWKLRNILSVKLLFDTKEISLVVSKKFKKTSENCFEVFESDNDDDHAIHLRKIKPLCSSVYLNVGKIKPDSSEAMPFIIEWIPNLLPVTQMGEITFRYELFIENREV